MCHLNRLPSLVHGLNIQVVYSSVFFCGVSIIYERFDLLKTQLASCYSQGRHRLGVSLLYPVSVSVVVYCTGKLSIFKVSLYLLLFLSSFSYNALINTLCLLRVNRSYHICSIYESQKHSASPVVFPDYNSSTQVSFVAPPD